MSKVKKLPDSYRKDTNSNNHKLLNLNEQEIAVIRKDQEDIFNALDIYSATGYTLDQYGLMVGQKRGLLPDNTYRAMILTKLAINLSQGNHESVINVLSSIFNCDKSDIVILDSEKPCAVEIKTFPLSVLVGAGFSSRQAVEMIAKLLPSGVTVDAENFEGTFEFADTADVYDENTGFGDIDQTIGGYLGLLLGDDDIIPVLPI